MADTHTHTSQTPKMNQSILQTYKYDQKAYWYKQKVSSLLLIIQEKSASGGKMSFKWVKELLAVEHRKFKVCFYFFIEAEALTENNTPSTFQYKWKARNLKYKKPHQKNKPYM